MITSAVRAKRGMREKYSAGIDGIAVWALTCLSAVLSAMDTRSVAEAIFRLAAPLVAAWLWERGMALERRRATGLKGIHWQITPERILVRPGLADATDRTTEQLATQRMLTKVALAAHRARADLLSRQLQAHPKHRCSCTPREIAGQMEQPCPGGPFLFLGPGTFRPSARGVVPGHIRNSNYARRFFGPAADGWYANETNRPARRVMVDLGEGRPWPGSPWCPAWPAPEPGQPFEPPKGHGWWRVEEGAVLASWAPIMRGLTPHGLRHGHKTWLAELGVPEILQADRMGHVVPGMRGVYTHISDGMVADMLAGLTRLWEESLAARAAICPHSPVGVLDELLAAYRSGSKPVGPRRRYTRVGRLRAAHI